MDVTPLLICDINMSMFQFWAVCCTKKEGSKAYFWTALTAYTQSSVQSVLLVQTLNKNISQIKKFQAFFLIPVALLGGSECHLHSQATTPSYSSEDL